MSECDSAFLPIQNYRIWMLLRHSFKVSHDENLIAGSSDEVWVVSQGKVASFHGNFQDHRKVVQCSLNQVNQVIAINVEWFTRFTLPYKIETEAWLDRESKKGQRIAVDIQDGLIVTPALVCHLYLIRPRGRMRSFVVPLEV
ncbi:hypothetical protein BT93_L1808 [Corymbia citriodora subsp. variegata]|uniref:Uncharacterized protein n=1 Tax=Corymbia citriodora subsp. variegata TaxID=360336 RepID=A0A8T0CN05_CORYI|nr:hypothetical protein BT93_L1808 [Corymbia citriodora subsp. variegata]KAF7848604.1 hypothetical protein BT93_L1808 [Corymbia citriodora subsp. variegata]